MLASSPPAIFSKRPNQYCQGWVQPFSPAFHYVTHPSPECWERSSAPRDPEHSITCAQTLNSLLLPPQQLHFPKSSNFASIMKGSDTVLHYLSAPAQGSKVLAEQALEIWKGGSVLSCGQRIGNAKLFIPNLEKNIEKGLGGLFPTNSQSGGV